MKNNQLLHFMTLRKRIIVLVLVLFVSLINEVAFAANPNVPIDGIKVSGVITDAETNEPLIGVNIVEKGTTNGVITDLDGNFTITLTTTNPSLVFSFIGYVNQTIAVTSETNLKIQLVPDIAKLDEVVVTGYGVQKKSDVTGSIASVSSKELSRVPVSGVDQALQGLAAGVNVIPVSGRPGDDAVIQIRGISSINGGEPLVIVDGVPGSLNAVAPSDIASIEVLKDASSAAIYGDTGGNGVIIITTKQGKAGALKTNFNAYWGFESPVSKLDLMNSEQWMSTVEETYPGDIAQTSRPDTLPNYDWQDMFFQTGVSQNYDISTTGGNEISTFLLSASYNNQTGIVPSSNYERITVRLNSEHKLTERIKFDEKISFINENSYGLQEDVWNQYYDGPIRQALIMQPNVPDYKPGHETMKDSMWANSPYGGSNPLAMLDMVDRVAKTNDFKGNFGLTVDIVKGLSFTSRFAGGLEFWDNNEFQDSYYNTVYDFRGDAEVKSIAAIGRRLNYTAQQLLNYNTTLASDHEISAMAGLEANRYWDYDYNGQRYLAPGTPDQLQYFSQSTNDTSINQIIEGSGNEERAMAYLGRLNYAFRGTYLLTANVRYSGRSSFGPENRFGLFPSLSLGWKFSNASFMQNQSFINFGKLRAGYGEVGTYAKSGTPYFSVVRSPQTLGYPFNNSNSSTGTAPIQIANPEIKWETIHMTNIGVDLGMLDNKLTASLEYFKKVNEDMLMLQRTPYPTGAYSQGEVFEGDPTSPEVNIGSISNSGFELTVGYKEQIGEFKYGIDANVSTLKNEVLELATDSLTGGGVHTLAPITLTREGGSISEFYGFETDGIFTREDCAVDANGEYIRDSRGAYTVINQPFYINEDGETIYSQPKAQPGDVRYKDLNGDGKVLTNEDKTSLGSPIPKLIYGFTINLEYKQFDFSAQFNGTIGNQIFNGTKQYLYYYQGYQNHGADFANRYVDADIIKQDPITGEDVVVVKQNLDTDVPANVAANYNKVSDFFVENASYLRMRNITLGYTLPSTITKSINIEKFRVYAGARNLFTLTGYKGINPEIGESAGILDMGIDASIYPVTKMFLFGVNVTF